MQLLKAHLEKFITFQTFAHLHFTLPFILAKRQYNLICLYIHFARGKMKLTRLLLGING